MPSLALPRPAPPRQALNIIKQDDYEVMNPRLALPRQAKPRLARPRLASPSPASPSLEYKNKEKINK